MKRLIFTALLTVGLGVFATGCRSCQSCHDYDPPVANCSFASCNDCGGGRAGSAGGCTTHGYMVDQATPYPGDSSSEELYDPPQQ